MNSRRDESRPDIMKTPPKSILITIIITIIIIIIIIKIIIIIIIIISFCG